jgi:hypothetical protein
MARRLAGHQAGAFGKGLRVFTTDETKHRVRIPSLFAWRSGAREEFEVRDERKALAAGGGKSFAFVLDFELLSRTRSAMQTMRKSALGDRLNCHEPGHVLEFEFLSRILRPVQKAPPA